MLVRLWLTALLLLAGCVPETPAVTLASLPPAPRSHWLSCAPKGPQERLLQTGFGYQVWNAGLVGRDAAGLAQVELVLRKPGLQCAVHLVHSVRGPGPWEGQLNFHLEALGQLYEHGGPDFPEMERAMQAYVDRCKATDPDKRNCTKTRSGFWFAFSSQRPGDDIESIAIIEDIPFNLQTGKRVLPD